jgi:uncharacterized membrane protein (DUF373 family)
MKYKSVKGLLKSDESLIPVTFIDKLEDILHGFLGILLFIVSILAAGYTLQRLIETRPFFPLGMIQGINDILFVVIILEIMRTVIVRFTDGIFQLDNFLIIGVIAAVRHILTVDSHLRLFLAPITDRPFPAPTADNLSVVAAYTWANRRNRRNPAEACNEDQRAGDGRHRSNVADTELRERPEHRRQIALTQILESQCPGIFTI